MPDHHMQFEPHGLLHNCGDPAEPITIGPTLLEQAASRRDCTAFWEAATLLDTLVDTVRKPREPRASELRPRMRLSLSDKLSLPRLPRSQAFPQTREPPVLTGQCGAEPIRFGGLRLPFAMRDLLDLLKPPAKLMPLDALEPYLPTQDRLRLAALRPDTGDFWGNEIHCFTDGSFKACANVPLPQVGWACVLIDPCTLKTFLCSGGWPLWLDANEERPSAFVSECIALIAASLLCSTLFQAMPVSLCVDCTAALGIAAGDIAGHGQGVAGILRRVSYLLRAVAAHPPRYHHVAGHKGCFANEVADVFAKLAARGCTYGDWSWGDSHAFSWWNDNGSSLDWAGMVIQRYLGDVSLPPLGVQHLALPSDDGGLTPLQCIEPFLRKRMSNGPQPSVVGRMSLTLMTYNVLSLCGKAFSDVPSDGLAFAPARPTILAECLQAAGVTVAAIQEARTPEGAPLTEPYLRFCSGSHKGQFGVEIWFRTQYNFVVCEADSSHTLSFERADFLVLHNDPRRIFVLFAKAGVTLLFVSAHAPHKGSESHLIDSWWAETRRLLDKFARRAPMIFMGDFNAAIGSVRSAAIGPLHQDQQDQAGDHLHDLVLAHSLWVPSTFEGVHQGSGGTYVQKRNGQESRLDFICPPESWSGSQVASWTDPSVHAGQPIIDHIAALVSVDLLMPFTHPSRSGEVFSFDAQAVLTAAGKAEFQRILSGAPRVDWAVGPDAHAAIIVGYLQRSLQASFPKPKRVKRHAYLSDETWALHLQVKSLRRRAAKLRQAIAFHSKALCFQLWRRSLSQASVANAEDGWLRQARRAADDIAQQLQIAAKKPQIWLQGRQSSLPRVPCRSSPAGGC